MTKNALGERVKTRVGSSDLYVEEICGSDADTNVIIEYVLMRQESQQEFKATPLLLGARTLTVRITFPRVLRCLLNGPEESSAGL